MKGLFILQKGYDAQLRTCSRWLRAPSYIIEEMLWLTQNLTLLNCIHCGIMVSPPPVLLYATVSCFSHFVLLGAEGYLVAAVSEASVRSKCACTVLEFYVLLSTFHMLGCQSVLSA